MNLRGVLSTSEPSVKRGERVSKNTSKQSILMRQRKMGSELK